MIKIAAIYDVHGNLPALEAVLSDIDIEDVDAIVIGGDTVAGPLPSETLTLLQTVSTPLHFIHGNGESEMLRVVAGEEPKGLTPVADKDARWVAATLDDAQIAFIQTWPLSVELIVDGLGSVLFCHATPQDDITIFTDETSAERVQTLMKGVEARTIVCGHTHMQFDRRVGEQRILNAGSVGSPFGKTGADWLLIDGDRITLRHTAYDLNAAADRVRQATHPDAANFADNRILSTPSKELILEFLHKVEIAQMASK